MSIVRLPRKHCEQVGYVVVNVVLVCVTVTSGGVEVDVIVVTVTAV